MSKKRRSFSSSEKVSILRKYLLEGIPVSNVCDDYNLSPTIFYRWQKTFFENGTLAFESENKSKEKDLERKILELEKKIIFKDEVLAELMGEHIILKKKIGEI